MRNEPVAVPIAPVTVPMSVPTGTPIKVALDAEVRIRKVGQPIHGKTMEPVYAFDKLLVPAGTTVTGKISASDGVPKKIRAMQAMDGNSPLRPVRVQFEELVMNDGRHVPLQTRSMTRSTLVPFPYIGHARPDLTTRPLRFQTVRDYMYCVRA